MGRTVGLLVGDAGWWRLTLTMLKGAPLVLWKAWRFKHPFEGERWRVRFPDAAEAASQRDSSAATGPRVALMIWSWGEMMTMKPIIEALRVARPHARLLITICRPEAMEMGAQLSDEEIIPLPFDAAWPVARWQARVRPDVVIFYEQFGFPTLLRSLWLLRVPYAVVHGRIFLETFVQRTANRLQLDRWMLHGLGDMLLSSPDYLPALDEIAPPQARRHLVGSIKFPQHKPQLAPAQTAELRAWIEAATGGAPLLVAGSTHIGEEEFVLDAMKIIRQNRADGAPVLLLAPRKPPRIAEVTEILERRGIRFSRRSQWTPDESNATAEPVEVLLLDTLGELSTIYQWATGVFVGGTLRGLSHNVAEPLIWSIPVVYGPRRGNFGMEQLLCESAGVGFRVETPAQLAAHWTELLDSPTLCRELARRADALVAEQNGAFERTMNILLDVIDNAATKSRPNRDNLGHNQAV